MSDERPVPALGWFHVSYEIIREGVHLHIQEANEFRGLRFHWMLDSETGERTSTFFIRGNRYTDLRDAIDAWKRNPIRKRRVRLNE